MNKSRVSPAIYVASVLCFLLPFVTVSCSGQKVASFTGVQLATGTSVGQPQLFGPPTKQKVAPEPMAALAALCAVAGFALSLAGSGMAVGSAVSGALGAVALLATKSNLDGELAKQGRGMFQASYEAGYSLAFILLVAGAAWNVYVLSQRRATGMVVLTTDHNSQPSGGSAT